MDLAVTGHAVLEGGNRILVHSVFDPCLYYYDIQDKCWGIYSRDFGVNKNSSAFLDGVPYSDDLDFEWVPAERPEGPSPSVNLVSHGRDELAVIWTGLDFWNVAGAVLHVYFSKLKISKVENAAGVVDELVAHPLAHKHYRVRASMFVDCLSTNNGRESYNDSQLANPEKIEEIANSKHLFLLPSPTSSSKTFEVVPINNLSSHDGNIWIKGKITAEPITQRPWYVACNKCNRSTMGDIGTSFTCIECNTEESTATASAWKQSSQYEACRFVIRILIFY
ncbi:hypothetical protein HYC85_019040 [Camellia sinensis]|uniref:Uncharacterized protein n=1 Tax=Camellia sinensis TaxID=4442 RepID=A0A7J7GW03_CAMSI|nr:hypothetical protein HYC85_019040 [Camellia sinensis]